MSRLALVLLLLAACAPPPPDPAPAPAAPEAPAAAEAPAAPAAPDAPAAPAAITGDYTVAIALTDIPATMPDSLRQKMAGTWVLALHDGGHYVVTLNGREFVQGPYVVSGNQLTFTAADLGPEACRTTGSYTWQMSDGRLTLTRVRDQCDGRAMVLTTRPLTRQG